MKILFFDGYCSLCNGIVDWGMAHDTRGKIRFASLQGETAKEIITDINLNESDTVLYWRNGKMHHMSSAILFFLADMGWPWTMAQIFFILPRFLRDSVYLWVARNRYRWFNKSNTCRLPTAAERGRLLN